MEKLKNYSYMYLIDGTIDIFDKRTEELLDTECFQFISNKIPEHDSVLSIVKKDFLHPDYLTSSKYELDVIFDCNEINTYVI